MFALYTYIKLVEIKKELLRMSKDIFLRAGVIAILCCCTLSGCRSSQTASTSSRHRRPPVVSLDPKQLALQNMVADGTTQQLKGDVATAMNTYRQILGEDPHYGVANYEMARLLSSQLRMDSAIVYAERAVGSDPDNVWYRLQCASLYRVTHQLKKMTAEWEILVKQHPQTLEYYYELSNAYLMGKDYKNAIGALNRVEKMIGITEMISLQKQKIWNAAGRPDKGNEELERLAEAMPQYSKYDAMLAESHMKASDYKKAKIYYDKVLATDPDDEYIHISLAQYYKLTNEPEKAYRELKKGFANPKLESSAKMQILTGFYNEQEFYGTYSKYAYDLMNDVMRNNTDSLATLPFANVLMQQEKYAEAAEQFKIFLTKDSTRYEVWEALLICESEIEGNDNDMLQLAKRASEMFPLQTLPYYIQGVCYYRQKDYTQAIAQLQLCERMGFPKGYLESETYSLLAACYHEQGRDKETYECYDKVLAKQPDDPGTLNNYAYYLAENGERLEEALTMIEKALKQTPNNINALDTYAWVLYKLGRYEDAKKQIERCAKLAGKQGGISDTVKEHRQTIDMALTK